LLRWLLGDPVLLRSIVRKNEKGRWPHAKKNKNINKKNYKSNQIKIVSAKLGPRIVTYQRNDLSALPEPLDPRSSSYCCGPFMAGSIAITNSDYWPTKM
jgi:stalled ribosome alternative rescue factor ArfA